MTVLTYRYRIPPTVPLQELEDTLRLAAMATAGLHGESRVRLEGRHVVLAGKRHCLIDASSQVGVDLNRIFLGFLAQEFRDQPIEVDRIATAEDQADEPEPYRTFADWTDELQLEPEQIALLRRVRPDLSGDTPLTISELDELIEHAAKHL